MALFLCTRLYIRYVHVAVYFHFSFASVKKELEFTSTTTPHGSNSNQSKSFYSDYNPVRTHIEHGQMRMSHSDSSGTTMLPVQHRRLMMLKHGRSYSTGDTPDDYTETDNEVDQKTLINSDVGDCDRKKDKYTLGCPNQIGMRMFITYFRNCIVY